MGSQHGKCGEKERVGEQEVVKAERGKQQTACAAEPERWEMHLGRGSEEYLQSAILFSVRLAQLVPPFVSICGRRHCDVLDLALCCHTHQHSIDLGRQRTSV